MSDIVIAFLLGMAAGGGCCVGVPADLRPYRVQGGGRR